MGLEGLFEGMGTAAPEAPVAETKANRDKAAKKEALRSAMQETMATDPAYTQKLRKLSDALEVVNTLGYGRGGNIVVDKTKKTDDGKRGLVATSKVVGYRIHNIGTEPIPYMTEVFTQNEAGVYVGTQVQRTLNPGEYANLTRQFMTMLTCQPEFSFTLANGKILSGSAKETADVKKKLESYYFAFNREEGSETPTVNDDEVKLSIDEEVNGKSVVKEEFVEAFGFLNNPKEGRKGGRKPAAGASLTAQDYSANYVASLLKQNGIM